MALSAAQHASKSRILTQSEPAKIPSTVDAVVLKHGRVFGLRAAALAQRLDVVRPRLPAWLAA